MKLLGRLTAAALALGLILAAGTLWTWADGALGAWRTSVWTQVEAAVGLPASYSRLMPTVLSALDFRQFEVTSPDGSPLLSASSLRIEPDWAAVVQGRWDRAVRKVTLINAVVTWDAVRDRALWEKWTQTPAPAAKPGAPGPRIAVEVHNARISWTDGPRSASLTGAFVHLEPTAQGWSLSARGSLQGGLTPDDPRAYQSTIEADLSAMKDFSSLSLRLRAGAIRSPLADVEPLVWQVTWNRGTLTAVKVADRVPLDFQARWTPEDGSWAVEGRAQGLVPARWVHLRGAAASKWASLAGGNLSGAFGADSKGTFSFEGQAEWDEASGPWKELPGPVRVQGKIWGTPALWSVQGGRLQARDLALGFHGTIDPRTFRPEGEAVLDRWTAPDGSRLGGRASFRRTSAGVSADLEGITWNDLSFPAAWVRVEPDGAAWRVLGGADLDQGPDRPLARAQADGLWTPQGGTWAADLSVQDLEASPWAAELGRRVPGLVLPPEVLGLRWTASAHVEASPGVLSLAGGRWAFEDPSRPGRRGTGTASWSGNRGTLAFDRAQWDGIDLTASLGATLSDDGTVDASLQGSLWGRPFDLRGRWDRPAGRILVTGAPGLTLDAQEHGQAWTVAWALDPYPWTEGWAAGGRGTLQWSPEAWSVQADSLTLRGTYPGQAEAFALETKAVLTPGSLALTNLVWKDRWNTLAGQGGLSWSPDLGQPWKGSLSVQGSAPGDEALTLTWAGAPAQGAQVGLRVQGLRLRRALVDGLDGRADLQADVQAAWAPGTALRLTWTAALGLRDGHWGPSALGLQARLEGTEALVKVRELSGNFDTFTWTGATADVDAASRKWSALAQVHWRFGASDFESQWKAGGSWAAPGTPAEALVRLEAQGNRWAGRALGDGLWTARWTSAGWTAALAGGGITAQGTPDGLFQAAAQAPAPFSAQVEGRLGAAAAEVRVRHLEASLDAVKDAFRQKEFLLTGGRVTGDLDLTGNPADPEVSGHLVLRDLRATSSYLTQALGPVDIPVTLRGQDVVVEATDVGPPGRSWMVSGGAHLDHLVPETFRIQIQATPQNPLPGAFELQGIAVAGEVSGTLVLEGSPLDFGVSGDLHLENTDITFQASKPDTVADPGAPVLGFNANLQVVTGRRVQFRWPNASLPLVQALANPGQSFVFFSDDRTSSWSLKGQVALRTGEINYLGRTFLVKEGLLDLQETQLSFDPRVHLRAEWRIRDNDQDVVIGLTSDGRLSRFLPRFSSTPYRSPEVIQQLVGASLAPTQYASIPSSETAVALASDVGTGFLLAPFTQTVKRNFGLDVFTVQTEIVKKSILNRNAPVGATDYLDNTRLFFGKYIGDDLFLQGTLAFRRGDIVAQAPAKLVVEPELQAEFRTPFFLLNWTLLPQHPEQLFVKDNTVTFRWDWSY